MLACIAAEQAVTADVARRSAAHTTRAAPTPLPPSLPPSLAACGTPCSTAGSSQHTKAPGKSGRHTYIYTNTHRGPQPHLNTLCHILTLLLHLDLGAGQCCHVWAHHKAARECDLVARLGTVHVVGTHNHIQCAREASARNLAGSRGHTTSGSCCSGDKTLR